MSLDAATYFQHLKAYVNKDYVVHDGSGQEVVLTEKYFEGDDRKPRIRKIALGLCGLGMAFKLDHDQFEIRGRKTKPALFHFLDDNGKAWSKRCDFVVFRTQGRSFFADCIEFKSKNISAETIVPQLKAGVNWCRSLKRTIEHYTGDCRTIRVRKFVFGTNENPGDYVEVNGQLKADPSIRYYHFDEVNGQPLSELRNASITEI
ncbi:hypothetical protein ACYZX9_14915 [Sphingomonas citri]